MIPWGTILRHAPVILGAAEALLARTRSSAAEAPSLALDERIGRLEQGSRESAQVIEQLAQQVHALTAAQQVAARRAAFGAAFGVIALLVAVVALVLAVAS